MGGTGPGGCCGCRVASHPLPILPSLRKSDRRIFHTKASLQKLSAKVSGAGGRRGTQVGGCGGTRGTMLSPSPQFSARLAEHSRQLAGVQNEYSFALVSATAHLEHYQRVELPAAMQVGAAQTPRAPSPGSHKEHPPSATARGGAGRVPLVQGQGWLPWRGQGCSTGGMWQCWGGSHPLSPRRWMGTSTSGSGSTCRPPAGRRWRPAGPPRTGSRALWRRPRG